MTVKTDVTKTGNTATVTAGGAKAGKQGAVAGRFTLKGLPVLDKTEATKPLYAVVGVADFALEQAKDVPADVTAELQKVSARLSDVPALVKGLPTQVEARVSTATDKAGDVYSQLTVRGRRLVTQIRRQPATEAAVAEGKEAVRKAEASATAARKSAKAGEKAAEGAADKMG
jgi:hypothetical protein